MLVACLAITTLQAARVPNAGDRRAVSVAQELFECPAFRRVLHRHTEFRVLWLRQVWQFKPTVETALAKEKDLLAGAEGPTIAVHLRGGDKRQENADLVRPPCTAVLPARVRSLSKPQPCGPPARGCLPQETAALCGWRCTCVRHYILCRGRIGLLALLVHLYSLIDWQECGQWCCEPAHTTPGFLQHAGRRKRPRNSREAPHCCEERAAAHRGAGSTQRLLTQVLWPAQGRPNTLPEDYAHAFREAYPDVKACPSPCHASDTPSLPLRR